MKNNGLLWPGPWVFSWFSWILRLDLMLKQASGSIWPTNQIVRDNLEDFNVHVHDPLGRSDWSTLAGAN